MLGEYHLRGIIIVTLALLFIHSIWMMSAILLYLMAKNRRTRKSVDQDPLSLVIYSKPVVLNYGHFTLNYWA